MADFYKIGWFLGTEFGLRYRIWGFYSNAIYHAYQCKIPHRTKFRRKEFTHFTSKICFIISFILIWHLLNFSWQNILADKIFGGQNFWKEFKFSTVLSAENFVRGIPSLPPSQLSLSRFRFESCIFEFWQRRNWKNKCLGAGTLPQIYRRKPNRRGNWGNSTSNQKV